MKALHLSPFPHLLKWRRAEGRVDGKGGIDIDKIPPSLFYFFACWLTHGFPELTDRHEGRRRKKRGKLRKNKPFSLSNVMT